MSIDLPGFCQICGEKEQNLIAHIQNMHPDAYGDGFLEWPDGSPVVIDMTLEPEDFA